MGRARARLAPDALLGLSTQVYGQRRAALAGRTHGQVPLLPALTIVHGVWRRHSPRVGVHVGVRSRPHATPRRGAGAVGSRHAVPAGMRSNSRTVNILLNQDFQGGDLYFVEVRLPT